MILITLLITGLSAQINKFELENLTNIELQFNITRHLKQQFIAAASIYEIHKIYYEDGQLQLNDLIYDHEAFITQSSIHLLRFNGSYDKIYIYIGYLNSELNDNNLDYHYKMNHLESECVSLCDVCSLSKCLCPPQYFGSYCQFHRTIAVLNIQQDIIIKPYGWKYLLFNTQQLDDQPLKLKIKDQSDDIQMGLAMDGLPNHDIPNIYYDAYQIPRNIQQQIFYIQTHLEEFRHNCTNCTDFTIGFHNPKNFPIKFYFELYVNEYDKQTYHSYHYYIFSALSLSILLLAGCILKKQQRQQQQQIILIQRTFRRRRRRLVTKPPEQGFSVIFIQKYFLSFYYLELIQSYPQLAEFVECVVCLESMAPKEIIDKNDPIYHCAVTPCFHMFHYHCLLKWLLTQKSCPLCRKSFTEQQISEKPWISLSNDLSIRESSRQNPYIKRMKTRGGDTQGSDYPLYNVDTENIKDDSVAVENLQYTKTGTARDLVL